MAKATGGGGFVPAPPGSWSAVCVDVIDLGIIEVTFGGKTKKQHKIRVVWQIEEVMENNKPYTVQKRYTLSLHEKASLRKDLESWRGRSFTPLELEGFDVETVLGVPCLLNVIEQKRDGETYANVASIMRLPKSMEAIEPRDYIRKKDREPMQSAAIEDQQQHNELPWEPSWEPSDDDIPF